MFDFHYTTNDLLGGVIALFTLIVFIPILKYILEYFKFCTLNKHYYLLREDGSYFAIYYDKKKKLYFYIDDNNNFIPLTKFNPSIIKDIKRYEK